MIEPIGKPVNGIALPGLTSAFALEITVSPTANRCGAKIYASWPSSYFIRAINAVLFGSYSIRSTVAGISNLFRLKSTIR